MDVKALKNTFSKALSDSFPEEEIQVFFELLADKYVGLDKVGIALNHHLELTEKQANRFQKAIKRLQKKEPIQYILGETQFLGLRLKVNPHILIPRPETEELVDHVLKELKLSFKNKNLKILDIGTGSGAIAISLAHALPQAEVYAMDVSKKALKTARENAASHKVKVKFIEKDVLYLDSLSQNYDIIISNPPYVRTSEKAFMQDNVLMYEPEEALFVSDENPLVFYQKIGELAFTSLHQNGSLYFEINEFLAAATKTLLYSIGFQEIKVYKDFRGKDRMVKVSSPQ